MNVYAGGMMPENFYCLKNNAAKCWRLQKAVFGHLRNLKKKCCNLIVLLCNYLSWLQIFAKNILLFADMCSTKLIMTKFSSPRFIRSVFFFK